MRTTYDDGPTVNTPPQQGSSDPRHMPTLALVVPAYNEEAVLEQTAGVLRQKLAELVRNGMISHDSFLCFVDDGSRDRTWTKIESLAYDRSGDIEVRGLKLTRNYGHQNALLAGMLHAKDCDCIVTMDADLQDDPNAIKEMITHFEKGSEIVYGVRSSRQSDSFFKRATARAFYRTVATLGVELIPDHADFRLLSRRAVELLGQFKEQNLFLRGLIPQMGLPSSIVYYERHARAAGETKYPLRKMVSFAVQGITSFSTIPLRLIAVIGLLVFAASLVLSGWVLLTTITAPERVVPGWASTVLPMYFLGGLQLLALGVLGEYLGKIYFEIKARPRFDVRQSISSKRL